MSFSLLAGVDLLGMRLLETFKKMENLPFNMSEDAVFPEWSYTQNFKRSVRGHAPQYLIDTTTRYKIYHSVFYQQYCFGVNLVSFVDRVQMLQGTGGLYGLLRQPCNFYCLFLKLLELEPSNKVIEKFLRTKCWQLKYLRLLAAMYIRFTYPPEQVYLMLEPLLSHYNQVAVLQTNGYVLQHFDEVIYAFLSQKFWCGITFPPLTPRNPEIPRISPLMHLKEQIRIEVFEEMGMNSDGELFTILKERQKLNLKGKKKLKLKKTKKPEKPKEQTQSYQDEINAENELRAKLGLPLLK